MLSLFDIGGWSQRNALRVIAAGAILCMPGCMTAPPKAPMIWLGQVSQGQQSISAPVRSWKEMRFTNLVRQQTDFSCGAAVIATIFNYAYGRSTTEQQVLVNMLKVADPDLVREKGFSLLDMKNYAAAVGMTGEGYQVSYKDLGSLKVPGVVLLNIKGYKHFVIVRKTFGDNVQIGDPALGNRVMTRSAFEKAWNGVVFVFLGEGYRADNILLNPPPPVSARTLFETRSPVANADVYDFGLGPAYGFVL